MIQILLGKKIEQTQKFLQDGTRIPVTEIDVPDNAIVQVKTHKNDKYSAIQIGIGKKKKPKKPTLGHAKKANLTAVPTIIHEVHVSEENEFKAGDFLTVAQIFKPGDIVDVTGTSKGKGFAGVVKRHNFRGGPKTHGQSDRLRAPGSIGQTTTPGRVYKGKRMAGHMGNAKVTIKNLKVIAIDEVNKKLYVLGLIPGVKNSIVWITRTGLEDKKFVPLFAPVIAEPEVPVESVPESQKAETKLEAKEENNTTEVKQEEKKESKKGEEQETKKS
jgi:large subunit ribosomal protein L3